MAIILNDNLSINAPKLVDDRTKKVNGLAYTSKADVLASIVPSRRAVGLIVLIDVDLYYFKTGTTLESDLAKLTSGDLPPNVVLTVTGDLVDNTDPNNPVIVFTPGDYDLVNFTNVSGNPFVRQADLDNKVDKIPGRGLSQENYTTSEKSKLASVEPNAQENKLEKVYLDGTELPITDKSVFISSGGDRLVNVGSILLDVNQLTLTTGFKWVIGGIFYENLVDWVNIVNYTSDTLKKRKDIIVGNQSGSFQRIQGVESETVPVRPTTPPNTILITTLDVFFSTVGDPTPPITEGVYVKKDLYILNIDTDGILAIDPLLADNVRNINLVAGFTEDINGFAENNSGNLYPRMSLVIQNSTGTSINIIHNGSAFYKLFFQDEEDYVLEDREILTFSYRDDSEKIFDFVASNKYTLNYINSPKVSRYYANNNLPYVDEAQVISEVLTEDRYQGQTFNIDGEEWWFKDGIDDLDLVLKISASTFPYKAKIFYVDGVGFPLPDDVVISSAFLNGSGYEIDWVQVGNLLSYTGSGTLTDEDFYTVYGTYNVLPSIFLDDRVKLIEDRNVELQGEVIVPNATELNQAVNLGQVEGLVDAVDLQELQDRNDSSLKTSWDNGSGISGSMNIGDYNNTAPTTKAFEFDSKSGNEEHYFRVSPFFSNELYIKSLLNKSGFVTATGGTASVMYYEEDGIVKSLLKVDKDNGVVIDSDIFVKINSKNVITEIQGKQAEDDGTLDLSDKFVDFTSDQDAIGGIKEFTGSVIVPEATELNQAVNLGQIKPEITITTTVDITTSTLDSDDLGQYGRDMLIDNDSNDIDVTIDSLCLNTYFKGGSGTITFVQGAGRTLIEMDGTAVLNGIVGSVAKIRSVGTNDYLYINNY